MGKKRRKKDRHEHKPSSAHSEQKGGGGAAAPVLESDPITKRGIKTIGAGIIVLIAGFVILTMTDPQGKNWASHLSPLLILGAYGIIALGIFLPDPEISEEKTEESSEPAASAVPESRE